jgi:hypothetical protein
LAEDKYRDGPLRLSEKDIQSMLSEESRDVVALKKISRHGQAMGQRESGKKEKSTQCICYFHVNL